MSCITSADFAHIFRTEAYAGVEYSFDSISNRCGIMVGGKPGFEARVQQFAAGLPFAAYWAWAVRRFADLLRPDTFLLRADCRAHEIQAITLYCRFPEEPDDERFYLYLQAAWPYVWTGPKPSALAAILGVPGPRGIGFRVDAQGYRQTALYYRLTVDTVDLHQEVLSQLADCCGYSESLADIIKADVHTLYSSGPVGVIGVDCGENVLAKAIKFDPANVPVSKALTFLTGKQASATRIAQLSGIAQSLRAQWVSYLGAKYNADGFVGWRVYFSVRPDLLSVPFRWRRESRSNGVQFRLFIFLTTKLEITHDSRIHRSYHKF